MCFLKILCCQYIHYKTTVLFWYLGTIMLAGVDLLYEVYNSNEELGPSVMMTNNFICAVDC